jgi:Zn-dependent peptidase ImmA (M78 family)
VLNTSGIINMEKPNYELATKKALKILENRHIVEPPIIPHKIAKYFDLNIISATFPNEYKDIVSGFLDVEKKEIYINAEDPLNRQTFTIAHELGHWILHKEKILENKSLYSVLLRNKENKENKNKFEQEADCFAANLLLPEKLIKTYSYINNIFDLAVIFCVSYEFMKNRLKFLGYNYE